jgi:DNA-binding NtrC family response regulator
MPIASMSNDESQLRLMLIDRDQSRADTIALVVSASLAQPCPIDVATGARQAIDLCRSTRYVVVLSDFSSLLDIAPHVEEAVPRLVKVARGALLVLLAEGPTVSTAMAAMRAGAHDVLSRPIGAAQFALRIGELARRHCRPEAAAMVGAVIQPKGPPPLTPPAMHGAVLPLWRHEQQIIEDAIDHFHGNVALAAAALELSPSTIYRKRQAWTAMQARRSAQQQLGQGQ